MSPRPPLTYPSRRPLAWRGRRLSESWWWYLGVFWWDLCCFLSPAAKLHCFFLTDWREEVHLSSPVQDLCACAAMTWTVAPQSILGSYYVDTSSELNTCLQWNLYIFIQSMSETGLFVTHLYLLYINIAPLLKRGRQSKPNVYLINTLFEMLPFF